ncbi:TY-Chap domain-containing protein [Bradyrhizobium sp.]|uniref:TY-Chap domain-containing protein n=1 Tax=Bradyrhizobium sp. TaxID=376 RepID=UPI003C25774C
MSNAPKDTTAQPKPAAAAPNVSQPEQPFEPSAGNETVADIVRRTIANNPRFKEVTGSKGYIFPGEHIHAQTKASETSAWTMAPRPGEPQLGTLSPVDQNWLASAIGGLVQIDDYRKGQTVNASGHCIFEAGPAYVQFQAPNHADHFICEAVSGRLVPDIAAILTPEKQERLVHEFGFLAPDRSPNFAQRIDIKSKADRAYAARLAYRIFREIYDVRDFAAARFKVWPREAVAL